MTAGSLWDVLGCRVVLIIGTTFSITGFCIIFLAPNLNWIFLGLGTLHGKAQIETLLKHKFSILLAVCNNFQFSLNFVIRKYTINLYDRHKFKASSYKNACFPVMFPTSVIIYWVVTYRYRPWAPILISCGCCANVFWQQKGHCYGWV